MMFYILPKNFILSKLIFLGGEIIMDQATISSYVILILSPILGYFAVSSETANAIYGIITAIIMLTLAVWNEKHNSTVISGNEKENENTDVIVGEE